MAQLSLEEMALPEENVGVSAENERLAKRCVNFEQAAKDRKLKRRGVHCKIKSEWLAELTS